MNYREITGYELVDDYWINTSEIEKTKPIFKDAFHTGNLRGVSKFLKLGVDSLKVSLSTLTLVSLPVLLGLSYKIHDTSIIGSVSLGASCLIAELAYLEYNFGVFNKIKEKIMPTFGHGVISGEKYVFFKNGTCQTPKDIKNDEIALLFEDKPWWNEWNKLNKELTPRSNNLKNKI